MGRNTGTFVRNHQAHFFAFNNRTNGDEAIIRAEFDSVADKVAHDLHEAVGISHNLAFGFAHQERDVLVVGGFHTPEITEQLRIKKIAYVVVSLLLTAVSKAPDFTLLSCVPSFGMFVLSRLFYLESVRLGPPMLAGVPFFAMLGLLLLGLPVISLTMPTPASKQGPPSQPAP